jgi:transposase
MLNLEDFMNIRDLKQQGWSVSAIADTLRLDRKTVRKHPLEAPKLQPHKRENPAPCKIDPYRSFLRERRAASLPQDRRASRPPLILRVAAVRQRPARAGA